MYIVKRLPVLLPISMVIRNYTKSASVHHETILWDKNYFDVNISAICAVRAYLHGLVGVHNIKLNIN